MAKRVNFRGRIKITNISGILRTNLDDSQNPNNQIAKDEKEIFKIFTNS